jgi:hypothetical protein
MRFHKARHFRFAENAVTTRILRRLHVQTTSSSPLRCFAQLGVPILTAALACLEWQRSAEDDRSASAGMTPCLAMWARLASSQSKAGSLALGIS